MLIFLVFLASAEIFEMSPSEIPTFLKSSDEFKIVIFCDISLEPCQYFFTATESQFLKLGVPVGKITMKSPEEIESSREYGLKEYPHIIYYKTSEKYSIYQGSYDAHEIYSILSRINTGWKDYILWDDLLQDLDKEFYVDGLILGININEWNVLAEALNHFMPFGFSNSANIIENAGCDHCILVFKPKIFDFAYEGKSLTIFNEDAYDINNITDAYYQEISFLSPINHIFLKKTKPLMMMIFLQKKIQR